ncbi:PepSY domain-containing protein [Thiocapsa sp.]|uniref:PepSY domain-containing protein n=1 Tax=Thiocapsa sp. TaxID=2024551 RepID=UPI003593F23B
MKKTLAILGWLAVFPVGLAMADDDCIVPMADWQPRDAVLRMAEDNGWSVRRIKIDDGCYEIDGRDAEGRGIEVTVSPGNLQVIEIEYKDDDGPAQRDRSANPGGRDDD